MKKKVFLGLLLLTVGMGVVFAQASKAEQLAEQLLSIQGQRVPDKADLIAEVEKTIEIVAFGVNEAALENWVKDLREKTSTFAREGTKKDYVFRNIVGSKAAKDAAINGIAGLAPDIIVPAVVPLTSLSTWMIQAQLAYAVAYTYGKAPKNPNEFKADMFMLLAGEDMVKAAAKEVKSLTAAQLADAGNIAFKGYFNSAEQKRLFTKIAEKMYESDAMTTVEFVVDQLVGLLIGPVGAIKDAYFAYNDMEKFAKTAQAYYCEFPKPDGYFINGGGKTGTGVALQFYKNGTVSVRPRLAGSTVGGNNVEIIQSLALGGGTYEMDKKGNIKITFDEVSWEGQWKTLYGGRPTGPTAPGTQGLNYSEVENLSKKTLNGKLTGYESIDLSNYFRSDSGSHFGDWFLVTPVKDGWASGFDYRYYGKTAVNTDVKVKFDSKGGSTPNPASVTRTTNSLYDVKLFPKVTRYGYGFLGWYTYAVGGTLIEDDTIVLKDKEHTLYAHWYPQGGTITFDHNGIGGPPLYRGVIFDSVYGALPEVSRNGYKFDGWWTKPTGGNRVTEKTKVAIAGNHTLYAHWTPDASAGSASAQPTMDKLTFAESGKDGYAVKQGNKDIEGDVVIPAAFANKPVTAIASDAFSGNVNITSVIIPASVTTINLRAFSGCKGLASITIPAGVTTINGSAFSNCTNLTSVTFLGKAAEINNSAFPGDLALKHMDGGAGTYTRKPEQTNWTRLGASAAPGQPTLDKLTFVENGKDGYAVKQGNKDISGAVVIPAAFAGKPVTAIASDAFSGNVNITSVIIPGSVTTINLRAFSGCKGLTSATVSAGVTTINSSAFSNCTSLNSVTFLGEVAEINNSAFPGDLALKHIDGGAGTYTRQTGQNNWSKR